MNAARGHNLLPPAHEPRQVGRAVLDILDAVLAHKAGLGLHDRWARNYLLGREQAPLAGPGGAPVATANYISRHRQRVVNALTDNHPTFNVSRQTDAGDEAVFATLERAAAHWWNEQEQQSVLEQSVQAGETYGVAIEKVIFNPDLEYGLGEVQTVVVDPFSFGLYPVGCRHIQDAEAVLHFMPLTPREASRRWPEAGPAPRPDAEALADLAAARGEIMRGDGAAAGLLSRLAGTLRALFGAAGERGSAEDAVWVCECWAKDASMTPEGPKYPGFIRRVTVACGSMAVLEDRGNPSVNPVLPPEEAAKTYLYDKFPFALANSLLDPRSIWGASDFEYLESLQREINKSLSQLTYHKDRCARPKIVNPRDSGVHNTAFTNRHGIINPSSMASAQGIRYLDFANNTKDIEGVLALYRDIFRELSGAGEASEAVTGAGPVVAYRAIAMLQETAAVQLRGKIRRYGALIRERGRMFVSHAQNWYAEKRWIGFSDQGGARVAAITGRAIRVPSRLSVVSGSTMPSSKIHQREEALALFQLGAIDREELLRVLEWSGQAEVLARMGRGGPGGPGGSDGPGGTNRSNGPNGAEGPNGTKRPRGPSGTNGPDGPDGADGAGGPRWTNGASGPGEAPVVKKGAVHAAL